MLPIEHDPINGEALRDDLVAVHDEQAPTMMCGVVAAPLDRYPNAAAHGRTQPNGSSVRSETRPTKLENSKDWPPGGGRVEAHNAVLEDAGQGRLPLHLARRARRPPNRKGRAASPTGAGGG